MTKAKFFHPDQLTAIRKTCDWRRMLDDLGVRADVKRCTATEFWGYSPFNPNEKTASFHMKAPGIWYDWSTHATAPGRAKPGGGVIELVQAVHATRGQIMKLNEAAGWIVDHGYSHGGAPVASTEASAEVATDTGGAEVEKHNAPLTIDLTERLSELGTHPAFVERGISEKTCRYLCCGYFASKRGMLAERLVFQVGGVADDNTRVILSHVGRSTTPEQEAKGKWRFYRGFNPSLELYNQDKLLLDSETIEQVRETGSIILVEGAFDVAKCVEAGIKNVVASFGARLSEEQAVKLGDALTRLSASRVIVFYDRDKAGRKGSEDAVERLRGNGIDGSAFDWEQDFASAGQTPKPIPEGIQDPCDYSAGQLIWLRQKGIV